MTSKLIANGGFPVYVPDEFTLSGQLRMRGVCATECVPKHKIFTQPELQTEVDIATDRLLMAFTCFVGLVQPEFEEGGGI